VGGGEEGGIVSIYTACVMQVRRVGGREMQRGGEGEG
jgi:hypothetical protein